MATIGSLAELRRYPVKSLAGEMIDTVTIHQRGVDGDRLWAVADPDGKLGSGKSTRRFRRMDGLLDLAASYDDDLVPVIEFPDGRHVGGGDPLVHQALSEYVGRPVQLRREDGTSHFDEGPLHIITTPGLETLARDHGHPVSSARMRSNLLLEIEARHTSLEETLVGRTLTVGVDLVLRVREPMRRCVMVEMRQVGLPQAEGLLDTVTRFHDQSFGVVADVLSAGTVQIGDPVELRS